MVQVLEEKLVRRKVSLKALDYGKVEEAAKGHRPPDGDPEGRPVVRQRQGHQPLDQGHGPKGVSSQTQGDQVRVSGKKRDDLQTVIAGLREEDFGLPLQFENFRD